MVDETQAERVAAAHQATNYHETVTDLRRELATSAEGWNKTSDHYLKLMHAQPRAETPAEVRDAYAGTLMAYSYSYTLAAVLGIAEREFGLKVAEQLAFEADEILTNGDFDDLNADVMPDAPPFDVEEGVRKLRHRIKEEMENSMNEAENPVETYTVNETESRVEVYTTTDTSGAPASKTGEPLLYVMHDPSRPEAGKLYFNEAEWAAFVAGVKDGEFDLDEHGSLPPVPDDQQ